MSEDVRILEETVLSHDWYLLKKTRFEHRRRDGSWQTLSRETYDRGNGAVILPYDPERGTILLTRQFRFPAFVNGHPEPLIEACAGLLDDNDPTTAILKEAEEELGCRIDAPVHVFDAFMSPGSVTEKLSFFIARYRPADRTGEGGGVEGEGEDIEVLEMSLDEALAMTADGRIADAKTIMLLQHLRLKGLV
ncbi:NUDIX domain-containing protein [Caulobacter segnis]|uniref:NUDIX domain-containing protein n=1 Tax=Caulobacter segnis TaxID=88688 RepID=UPI002410B15B|nr:NUDIX domain-containing protein [Caulobacter segnis]MDG2522468.1 NUDIX domain-containing protein [Caulobacter segnis]